MYQGIKTASVGLNQAILTEAANKPAGSSLVIANDSETVLTRQQALNVNAALRQPASQKSSTFAPHVTISINGNTERIDPDAIADRVLAKIDQLYANYKREVLA